MGEFLGRAFEQLLGRMDGPLHVRFLMQPIMAAILAIRAGLRDGRAQRLPYLWAIIFEPAQRRTLIREGWKDVARVFVLAYVIDCIYQVIELRWIYPVQSLIVAFLLAVVPYVLIRGPAARLGRQGKRSTSAGKGARAA